MNGNERLMRMLIMTRRNYVRKLLRERGGMVEREIGMVERGMVEGGEGDGHGGRRMGRSIVEKGGRGAWWREEGGGVWWREEGGGAW